MKLKKQVLVLEDDKGIRWSLENILAHLGCEVTEAANASQFIAAIDSDEHFDLLITDFNLADPSFDGVHAVRMIREKDPELPVVMITAELLSHRRVSQLQGTDRTAVLEKPFSISRLLKAFAELGVSMEQDL